jgi:hypothetical protein
MLLHLRQEFASLRTGASSKKIKSYVKLNFFLKTNNYKYNENKLAVSLEKLQTVFNFISSVSVKLYRISGAIIAALIVAWSWTITLYKDALRNAGTLIVRSCAFVSS